MVREDIKLKTLQKLKTYLESKEEKVSRSVISQEIGINYDSLMYIITNGLLDPKLINKIKCNPKTK